MKFSTETIEQITNILASEFEKQMGKIEEDVEKMGKELRSSLQEVGQKALGDMLSKQDEKMYQKIEKCE